MDTRVSSNKLRKGGDSDMFLKETEEEEIKLDKHFFPAPFLKILQNVDFKLETRFIPNSVLVKLLWPDESVATAWKKLGQKTTTEQPEDASQDDQHEADEDQGTGAPPQPHVLDAIRGRLRNVAIVRSGDLGDKINTVTEALHIVFLKRPSALREADTSWLTLEEQELVRAIGGEEWKALQIKVVYDWTARDVVRRVDAIIKTRACLDALAAQAAQAAREKKSEKLSVSTHTPRESSSVKSDWSDTSYEPSTSKAVSSKSQSEPSRRRLIPTDRATVEAIAKYVKECVEFLVKCVEGLRVHRFSRKEVAAGLESIGVCDPDGIMLVQLNEWVKLVQENSSADPQALLTGTIKQWLKRWMMQYLRHVLRTVEELHQGTMSGRVRLSMVQLILQQRKGFIVRPSVSFVPSKEVGWRDDDDQVSLLSLTCPQLTDESLTETVTPVDALNYFCEMCSRHVKCPSPPPVRSQPADESDFDLKWLGGQMVAAGYAFHRGEQGVNMPPFLHLPLKTAHVTLFDDPADRLTTQLISYQTCSKYFTQAKSYVK